jgi:DNA-binding CsgD family transcriptional regulator
MSVITPEQRDLVLRLWAESHLYRIEIAREAGVSPSYVSKHTRGRPRAHPVGRDAPLEEVLRLEALGYNHVMIAERLRTTTRTIRNRLGRGSPFPPGRFIVIQEEIDEMIALRREGWSYGAIAQRTGYVLQTVRRYVEHLNVATTRCRTRRHAARKLPLETVVEALRQGLAIKAIAAQAGCSPSAVYRARQTAQKKGMIDAPGSRQAPRQSDPAGPGRTGASPPRDQDRQEAA